jgi:hypothetical protein
VPGARRVARLVCVVILLPGCSGQDDGSTTATGGGSGGSGSASTAGSGGGSGSGSGGGSGACQVGCEAVIAAGCANGPPDQAGCEADCDMLLAGQCSDEYDAYLVCGEGEAVTCDNGGYPVIEACEAERQAFLACINP